MKQGVSVLGFDTASRTGWAKIETTATQAHVEWSFVDIDSRDLIYKYTQYAKIFHSLINNKIQKVIIEETYFGRNLKVFQMLSRLGGIVFGIAVMQGVQEKQFISAIQARKYLGFKCNVKKEVVHAEFHERLKKVKVDDIDAIDAIILALCGIFEEERIETLI